MTLAERSRLVLAVARVLYVNGQSTDRVVAAAKRIGRALGLCPTILPRWGELQLESEDAGPATQIAADPVGVDMDRVASTMRVIEDVEAGRLAPDTALTEINAVS